MTSIKNRGIENMKYKVGDKVRIKSIDWYNKNKDEIDQEVDCGSAYFISSMVTFCEQVVTISSVQSLREVYHIKEDSGTFDWTDEMIEGLAKEETKPNIIEEANTYWDSIKDAWICPQGYQFVDENGNIINAQKIVLEKKENRYPKTYEECNRIMGVELWNTLWGEDATEYEEQTEDLIDAFIRLKVCRDAYWKIADNWKEERKEKSMHYVIQSTMLGEIVKVTLPNCIANYLLDFPTEEMRDAFYENFKELIENCKELL